MDDNKQIKPIRKLNWLSLAASAALIATGLFLILWPDNALRYICYLAGGCAAVYGIFNIACFVIAKDSSLAFQMVIGALAAALGVFVIGWPSLIYEFMQTAVSVAIIASSLFSIRRAFVVRKAGCRDWGVYLGISVVVAVFGVLFIALKDFFKDSLYLVMGIVLVAAGVADLFNILRLAFVSRRQRKNASCEPDHEVGTDPE